MSTTTLTKVSHQTPHKFRASYKDIQQTLGEDAKAPINQSLPTIYSELKIGIVGGGFAGLSTALSCLLELKTDDFVIFDKHRNFGGTWWANTYPGCASDIPAVWYSFFGEVNSNWSKVQPPQYEMEEYILAVVKKHKLESHGRFRTWITNVKYNDDDADWTIHARDMDSGQHLVHKCKILCSCQGGLVQPAQLKVKGMEDFQGKYLHSAMWDHSVDFKNKNVVVVGNGCSANQVVPRLVKDYDVKGVYQVARSKHYIMPPIPAVVHFLYNLLSFSRYGIVFVRWLVAAAAESRWPLYKGDGYVTNLVRRINKWQSVRYMKTAPEQYHDMIIPDYKIGCKRLIFDHHYIPCLRDPKMHLSNSDIDHVGKDSVVLKDGTVFPCDILVACTGYNLKKGAFSYEIVGRNNSSVWDYWNSVGISAYKTVLLPDCPNAFVIGGPNSATGHSSVVLAIENGTAYFTRVAKKVLSGQYKSFCVKTEKYNEWFTTTQSELRRSVFGSPFGGCSSWYTSEGINFTAYPYSQIWYWWDMRHPQWKDLVFEKEKAV